jgi:uncharacterized protein (TIGR03435 family)
MISLRRRLILLSFGLVSIPVAVGQNNQPRLVYDVASIRPSTLNAPTGGIDPLPGGSGYKGEGVSLKVMLSVMYRVPLRQIVGGPDWLNDERFDVQAITETPYSTDDLHLMFQNLLADRFHLRIHKETKLAPAYVLTIAKSGLKMAESPAAHDHNIPITNGGNNEFIGNSVRMGFFCWWLGLRLQNDQRPVIDQTGLSGAYDFKLSFRPQLAPNASMDTNSPEQDNRPSIFDALKDQLGLVLTPQKGPVETLVIDSVERPTEN